MGGARSDGEAKRCVFGGGPRDSSGRIWLTWYGVLRTAGAGKTATMVTGGAVKNAARANGCSSLCTTIVH